MATKKKPVKKATEAVKPVKTVSAKKKDTIKTTKEPVVKPEVKKAPAKPKATKLNTKSPLTEQEKKDFAELKKEKLAQLDYPQVLVEPTRYTKPKPPVPTPMSTATNRPSIAELFKKH